MDRVMGYLATEEGKVNLIIGSEITAVGALAAATAATFGGKTVAVVASAASFFGCTGMVAASPVIVGSCFTIVAAFSLLTTGFLLYRYVLDEPLMTEMLSQQQLNEQKRQVGEHQNRLQADKDRVLQDRQGNAPLPPYKAAYVRKIDDLLARVAEHRAQLEQVQRAQTLEEREASERKIKAYEEERQQAKEEHDRQEQAIQRGQRLQG